MIIENMGKAPGKLDHATVVAYEVGNYHGEGDEEDLSVLSPGGLGDNSQESSEPSTPQGLEPPTPRSSTIPSEHIRYESPV
jgi:hypothetical protein